MEPVTDAKELNGVFGTSYTKAPAYKDSGTGGSYALMASKYTPNFNSMYFKCWVSSGDTVMDLAQFGKMSFHSSNAQIAHVDEAEDVKQVGDYVYVKLTALVGSQTGEDIYLNAWFGAEAGKSALVKCYDEPHIKISAQADGISLDNATDLNHVFVNEMTPSVWTLQAEEETPFFYTDGTPASTIRWSQVFPEESYYDSVFISFDTGAPSVEGTLLSGITAIGPEIKATAVVNPTCKVVLQASSTMVPDDRALISSCCSTFGMVFIKDETAAT